jgi:hypothetical protein
MKKKSGYEFNVEEFLDYDWLLYHLDAGTDDIEFVSDNPEKAAEYFGVPQEFVEAVDDAFKEMAGELIRAIRQDLSDLADMIDEG